MHSVTHVKSSVFAGLNLLFLTYLLLCETNLSNIDMFIPPSLKLINLTHQYHISMLLDLQPPYCYFEEIILIAFIFQTNVDLNKYHLLNFNLNFSFFFIKFLKSIHILIQLTWWLWSTLSMMTFLFLCFISILIWGFNFSCSISSFSWIASFRTESLRNSRIICFWFLLVISSGSLTIPYFSSWNRIQKSQLIS